MIGHVQQEAAPKCVHSLASNIHQRVKQACAVLLQTGWAMIWGGETTAVAKSAAMNKYEPGKEGVGK